MGAYLVQSQLQSSSHTCSLFLTASAQNLLCLQLAEAAGVDVGSHFLVWSEGAIVPGLIGAPGLRGRPAPLRRAARGAGVVGCPAEPLA